MSAAAGRARLVNQALALLGQAASFSVDATDKRAGKVDLVWPLVVSRCFGLYAWSWATAPASLVRHATAPVDGFEYAFDLPAATAGPAIRFFADGEGRTPLRDFAIVGTELHCRAPAVWTLARYPVDPETWDPFFAAAFVVALASALAVPLQQDETSRDAYERQAFGLPSEGGTGGLFGRLIAADRASQPMRSPWDCGDPLTDARWQS